MASVTFPQSQSNFSNLNLPLEVRKEVFSASTVPMLKIVLAGREMKTDMTEIPFLGKETDTGTAVQEVFKAIDRLEKNKLVPTKIQTIEFQFWNIDLVHNSEKWVEIKRKETSPLHHVIESDRLIFLKDLEERKDQLLEQGSFRAAATAERKIAYLKENHAAGYSLAEIGGAYLGKADAIGTFETRGNVQLFFSPLVGLGAEDQPLLIDRKTRTIVAGLKPQNIAAPALTPMPRRGQGAPVLQ